MAEPQTTLRFGPQHPHYDAVLERLAHHHIGAARGVRARDLAAAVGCPERELRHVVSQLREQGVAVCGTPASGYFVAATADELTATCEFLRARALQSLHLEACLRHLPLPVLLGQLRVTETADRPSTPSFPTEECPR
jgi:hypothetical protein